MARECPTAPWLAQSQRATLGRMAQPVAPAMFQVGGRGGGRGAASSSAGFHGEGPSALARIFTQAQQEADTSNTVVSGTLTFECSDVYVFVNPSVSFSLVALEAVERLS